jgi:anti-anti-sigma factor
MKISVSKNGNDIYLMKLSGAMDIYTSNQLKDSVMKIIKNNVERLVIDLDGVKSVDSSGIGALVAIVSTLKKLNCPLVIVVVSGPVLQALEATSIKSYFTIVPSLQEALSVSRS